MLAFFTLVLSIVSSVNARDFTNDSCSESTPLNFHSDFLGNCTSRGYNTTTCNLAWTKFSGAFVNKDPMLVQPEDYADYFKVIPMNVERNKVLFWSDTRELANIVAMMSDIIVTSHDIKAAQILNAFGLDACWCSNEGNSGLNHTSPSCPPNTTNFFWAQFSLELAKVSEGIVFFLVDGNESKPYDRNSYFTCYEILGLEKDRITRLVALNIHKKNQGESCGEGTLVDLREDVEKKGIRYECHDIYGTIKDAENVGPTYKLLTGKIMEIQASKAVKTNKDGIMLASICGFLALMMMM